MLANARVQEMNIHRPGDRFVAEYYQMRMRARVQARLHEARKQVELAAARVMPAR
ncbi:MAG: hypothetical protein IT303_17220 [Dehalococcoidia bacterium]|nr:hypothetical protein [Dehalococcoidia bacterium]